MSLMCGSGEVNNMQLSVLCLLTVALAFVPAHAILEGPYEKPGECPELLTPFSDRMPCQRPCTSDFDCPRNLKCCPTRCGRTCVEPKKVPRPKPGMCPHDFDLCVECRYDRDCEPNFKCCPIGCGKTCMEPVGRHCPRDLFMMCKNECHDDSDCGGKLKCCYNKCERRKTCMEPIKKSKPGSCPRPIPHLVPCEDQCSDDSDCPWRLKCCYSGCGKQCTHVWGSGIGREIVTGPQP